MAEDTLTLSSLPLFPLGTVLFPGGELPLRVFEVRYLDLIEKCHKTGAPFGVIHLREGSEVQVAGAPEERLETVGTMAHIVAMERTQAGLLHVKCEGRQRFQINQQKRLKHGLWVADVTLLARDAAVLIPDDLKHSADALHQLRETLRQRGTLGPDLEPSLYEDCGWVANRWCELLPLSGQLKQQLMVLDSPLLRLELVADILNRAGV
ncbi:LON peptidase substrate-binding domain-containing protein [Ottowia caeni]|uniref:LON peptidase substrate-binding domain-containing protein n=1 Tax=Ottowia caeni TaxID=2870339 RepID=UPI001E5D2AE7|nr:LON peptidase substrate-binding domain-containing protein [Ottowia caeni]